MLLGSFLGAYPRLADVCAADSSRYSQARKEEEAVRLLEEMVATGLKPERRVLSSMIVAHSWGSITDMRRCACKPGGSGGFNGWSTAVLHRRRQKNTPF